MTKIGGTRSDIADYFKVYISTIDRWAARYEEFGAALKIGKGEFDGRVEESLARRAVGYTFDSEKIMLTKAGKVIRVPIKEHVPPDVTACIFWLKNRKSKEWRDRVEQEVEAKGEIRIRGGLPDK